MKIRCYSDIHNDHYNLGALWYPPSLPDDKDTILILAGDIWIGTKFITVEDYNHKTVIYNPDKKLDCRTWIEKVAERFKEVIIVLGNHDYWPQGDLTIRKGGNKANSMLADLNLDNVRVLDCDVFGVGDYLFVGATLWSDMNNYSPLTMYNMPQFMRYDGKIAYDTWSSGGWSRFTSGKWVSTFIKHRDYIKFIAENNRDKKLIVVTHHAPVTFMHDPMYENDDSNGYYMSDLSDLILDNENIIMWVFGHSHFCNVKKLEHCTLINRSVGYNSEHKEMYDLIPHDIFEV